MKEILSVALGLAVLGLVEAGCSECRSSVDCNRGQVCSDGDCKAMEVGSDMDSGIDTDPMGDDDDDTSSDSRPRCELDAGTDLDTDTGTSECCTKPGDLFQCWRCSAVADRVTCRKDGDCRNGHLCASEGDWKGFCECDDKSECNDGVCVPDGAKKYCGPSFCNGFFVCSCFGGCVWWAFDSEETPQKQCEEGGLVCTEGDYPYPVKAEGSTGKGSCSGK